MSPTGGSCEMRHYPIVLTVGAREAIREMRESEREELARALRSELFDRDGTVAAPQALIRPTGSRVEYPALLLTSGHVAVFRPMEKAELKELADERHESVAPSGVIVHDILEASAIRPGSVVVIDGEEL